jgi:hypothetical protein
MGCYRLPGCSTSPVAMSGAHREDVECLQRLTADVRTNWCRGWYRRLGARYECIGVEGAKLSQANLIALVVGFSAAFVALVGYVLSQASIRRSSKANSYATALEAVKEFEELPYRIARRPASDERTRADLGGRLSDAYVKLELYRAWTAIDSPLAGEAYSLLVDQDHKLVRSQIMQAWKSPLISSDEQVPLNGYFDCDNIAEWDCCIRVMRRELSMWAPLLRRGTRSLVRDFKSSVNH